MFKDNIISKCINRRLNLCNMFLGVHSAQLISRWIITEHVDITHLNLAQNKLGDMGLEHLAPALAVNKYLILIDLSQNGLTPKSSHCIAFILSKNNSIIDLNLGSIQGSNRNRIGKDGGVAISYGFSLNQCLIQYLHLRSVTIGNEEVEMLADSLEDYLYLLHLDLSENRLEGMRGGILINRILARKCRKRGGQDLEYLNLANNNLGQDGFAAITHQLILSDCYERLTLNVANNCIEEIRLLIPIDSNSERIFNVSNLTLDGNLFKSTTLHKLASLLQSASLMTRVSFKSCGLGDEGLSVTFEAM